MPTTTRPRTPARPQPRVDPKRPPGSTPGSLNAQWHGIPVWAWTGIGVVTLAGAYLFIRRYRAAKAAASSTTDTTTSVSPFGGSAGWGGGSLPVMGGGGTPLPSGDTPAPTPTPAGSPGLTFPTTPTAGVFTAQTVRDLFARYGFTSDAQIQGATQGPSTETAQERIDRIVRDLNNGVRSVGQVTNSISLLPGAPGTPAPTNPVAVAPNPTPAAPAPTPVRPADWPTTWPTVITQAKDMTAQQNAAWANPFSTIGQVGAGTTPGTTRYGY